MSGRRGSLRRPACELFAELLILDEQLGYERLKALVLRLQNFYIILHGLPFSALSTGAGDLFCAGADGLREPDAGGITLGSVADARLSIFPRLRVRRCR